MEIFSVIILPVIVFGTGVFIDMLIIQAGTVLYPGLPFQSSLPKFFTLKVSSYQSRLYSTSQSHLKIICVVTD